jgi:hypothetical protein
MNKSQILEYFDKNYDTLVEAYGKAIVDKLIAKFKEQVSDYNIKNPTTGKQWSEEDLKGLIDDFDKLRGSADVDKEINNYDLKKLIKTVNTYKTTKSNSPFADMPDKIYDEGGIKIFNGNRENVCKSFAGEVPWCITRGAWLNYRNNPAAGYPTFYLIKNTNLPDSDRLSFVAVQSREGDRWVYTNRANSPYESRVMSFNDLLREVPWLTEIPDLKSKLPHQPRTKEEEDAEKYKNNPISYREWSEKPLFGPSSKYEYLVMRSRMDNLFTDKSLEDFTINNLVQYPKILDKVSILTGETSVIPQELLLKHIDKFPKSNQTSILKNIFENSLSLKVLSSDAYSWELKKILVKFNKFKLASNEKMYVTEDGNTIVVLTINPNNIKADLYKEDDEFKDIDLNKNTATKYLKDYPEIDTIPFKVLLKLASKDAIEQDVIKKAINTAKESSDSALIFKKLEDDSSLLIDTNTFDAYKIAGSKISKVPFNSEEVQTALANSSGNTGAIDNIKKMFSDAIGSYGGSISKDIDKDTLLSITRNIPANDRIILRGNNRYILIPADNDTDETAFRLLPIVANDVTMTSYTFGGDNWKKPVSSSWRNPLNAEDFQKIFGYLRDQNVTYNDGNLRSIFNNRSVNAIRAFVEANPPLDPANNLRPIIYQDNVYLFNTPDPRNSYRISPQSGRLLQKSFSARDVAAITGQQTPAAARAARTPAAAATRPPAATPVAGGNAGTTPTLIANAGLTRGFEALPASFRSRIAAGTPVNTNRTARSRQAALGNRGRVIGAISAGQDQLVIIQIGDNTFAQASFQPDARHFIITPTRALNMGRVGNFVDFVSNNANLTETQKETLTRIALGAATKEEIEEIKAKTKPYKDLEVTNEYIIREFDENINPIELKWHRDNENRVVEIVGKTDWKLQLENQLPVSINQPISIPKGEWHRVIKGNGKLTLKIIKEESTQYNVEGLLLTNTIDRPQKDILSDIRSLPGITIVSSKDYDLSGETSAFSNPNYYTILKIKVDPHPYPDGFKDEDLQQLFTDIRAIKGVRNFKLNKSVEKKTV